MRSIHMNTIWLALHGVFSKNTYVEIINTHWCSHCYNAATKMFFTYKLQSNKAGTIGNDLDVF